MKRHKELEKALESPSVWVGMLKRTKRNLKKTKNNYVTEFCPRSQRNCFLRVCFGDEAARHTFDDREAKQHSVRLSLSLLNNLL